VGASLSLPSGPEVGDEPANTLPFPVTPDKPWKGEKRSCTYSGKSGESRSSSFSPPLTKIQLGRIYVYQVQANDPYNAPLTYSLVPDQYPTGMAISSTGLVTWTPTDQQGGLHNVEILASDCHQTRKNGS
jgi:hypothetical protein